MLKNDFIRLYGTFLSKVVKNILVSDKIKNELYGLYYYLDESDFRLIFNEFYLLITRGILPQKIEPSLEEWKKMVFNLYLDKAAKRGYRLKTISPEERDEVGAMAREMSERLSEFNS